MTEPSVKTALDAASSHPAVGSTIATAATALGAASMMGFIQGVLGLISMLIGILVGLFVLRLHWIKYKILKRAWEKDDASFTTEKDLP